MTLQDAQNISFDSLALKEDLLIAAAKAEKVVR